MNPKRLVSLLLVTGVFSIAGPRPSSGQSTGESREAQDTILRERVVAFCQYEAEQKKGGKPLPAGDISFSGFGGSNWVFKASEIQSLRKKCEQLMKLMERLK